MNDYISSLVRHALTSVGGSLVAKGLITATAFDQVTGSLIVVAGVVWSVVSKTVLQKLHLEQIASALNTPAPETPVTAADVASTKK